MKLNLTKPLAFFDLEATGVDIATDRIVEISIYKIMPDGTSEVKTRRVNPTIPIPLQASLIHGIYDKDVANEPTFKNMAKNIASFLDNCDLAGYNSNKYDVPLLFEEFSRAEVDFDIKGRKLIDVQNIFHQMEQRTLKAAYKFYCHKDLENAHSAEADIKATYDVFIAQLEKYDGVEYEDKKGNRFVPVKNDMNALHEFSRVSNFVDLAGRVVMNEKGVEVFNFGKHKGIPVEVVFEKEPSYYAWIMKGEFAAHTKKVVSEIRLRNAFGKK